MVKFDHLGHYVHLYKWYILEGKMIKTKLLTQSKEKSFFQQCSNVYIETQATYKDNQTKKACKVNRITRPNLLELPSARSATFLKFYNVILFWSLFKNLRKNLRLSHSKTSKTQKIHCIQFGWYFLPEGRPSSASISLS